MVSGRTRKKLPREMCVSWRSISWRSKFREIQGAQAGTNDVSMGKEICTKQTREQVGTTPLSMEEQAYRLGQATLN
eukprot:scaffold129544_cov21-Tisochrysis_lutea.AAC.1